MCYIQTAEIEFHYQRSDVQIVSYQSISIYHDSDVCTLCNLNVCGDEYHYVCICPFFKHSRTLYLKPYFYTRPSLYKFRELFSSSSAKTISNLSKLVNIIFNQF